MNADATRLKALIAKGEGLDVEFKACRGQLPRSVYETVCAFLNRHGGTLLLGVGDDGALPGIDSDAIEQVRKDFVTGRIPSSAPSSGRLAVRTNWVPACAR